MGMELLSMHKMADREVSVMCVLGHSLLLVAHMQL